MSCSCYIYDCSQWRYLRSKLCGAKNKKLKEVVSVLNYDWVTYGKTMTGSHMAKQLFL